ncbi:MAG: hypothetical protein R2762_03370 [Bryobacteraceae bacterium]
MSNWILILLAAALVLSGQQPPSLGCFAGAGGAIVPVWGLAGNLVAGKSWQTKGSLLGAYGGLAVVRGAGVVTVLEGDREVARIPAEEPVAAGFDSGAVVVLLAGRRAMWIWSGNGEPVETGWHGSGEPLAVTRHLWVERFGAEAWRVGASGARVALGTGVTAAALWPDGAVLMVRGARLVFRSPRGEEQDLGDADGETLVRVGAEWAQSGRYAIHRRAATAERFLAPEPSMATENDLR